MKKTLTLIYSCLFSAILYSQGNSNSLNINLVDIPQGYFWMGSEGKSENFDEAPLHKVYITEPFKMGATEITNAQYEAFDPSHKEYRGKYGFSENNDDAAIYISYKDAIAFCEWLSKKEGITYRLPTEAEWEYACRAGTYTPYWTGISLPDSFLKNQKLYRDPVSVSLQVGQTRPNTLGLYDMHGNIEEWCSDWYAPYESQEQTNPLGAKDGLYKVTRGGSHGTPVEFLRSANRMAMIPEDKHWLTGFRVVQGEHPEIGYYSKSETIPFCMQDVNQAKFDWKIDNTPIFKEPVNYIIPPDCNSNIPFYNHNHCPSITWCDNGDLLAIWFSANQENGREMVILGSRLRNGNATWDPASLFFKVPDRNMTGSALFNDKQGRLIHTNGVEAAGDWQNLAMVQRTSADNGATWSKPRLIGPEHKKRHQVISGTIRTKAGYLIQLADASPESNGGTAMHISKDNGQTWQDPGEGKANNFTEGDKGGSIAGIHAGIVELSNGNLMALGRGDAIQNKDSLWRMPMSISSDLGESWTYSASIFPPIDGGQRLVLMKLNEGPIMLISFTNHPYRLKNNGERGMEFTNPKGEKYNGEGMYAALSWDDGKTWPVKKLITDGKERLLYGQAWTGFFLMNETQAEPQGYLAATQSPDNIIHLISSGIHYQFNLEWLTNKSNSK
ncbi:SUMF1/EgtB/PvdO family nonheme iron enzyme [Dysgonomonas sp. ZJ709]|uniref:SUMF1/EgtB/PvdO family nonheme iron enzyme n=1 Tax=Dysgonomonas sp. ZJ709 TaxID=2709797 RepID=UPI0013ED30C1|nr:SUMF1/EgtB/PvdO family nonheme iron enzyme [Dysgonomonas sp. ZJ709]